MTILEVLARVEADLNKEQATLAAALTSGNILDFAGYKDLAGRHHGLAIAKRVVAEWQHKVRKYEED